MAQKKYKTQAERAATSGKSHSKAKEPARTPSVKQKNTPETEYGGLPLRFITSTVFLGLFVLLLVVAIVPQGAVIVIMDNLLHGLLGGAGFIVTIPAMLYLFFIHAFSGKRPVLMRTVCMFAFISCCGCLSHQILDADKAVTSFAVANLYNGGISGQSGGLICGLIAELCQYLGPVLPYIIFVVAAILTFLGALQITIPSIIRAIRERPRADWELEEAEPRQEPAAVVVNHIATKRIEHIENQRQKAEERAKTQVEVPKTSTQRASDIFTQIEADIETPVAVAGNTPSVSEDTPEIIPIVEASQPADRTMPALALEKDIPDPPAQENTVSEEKPQKVKVQKVTKQDTQTSAQEVAKEIEEAEQQQKPAYCFPPIDLLQHPMGGYADGTAEMRENTKRLNETLASFKIEAHIINVTRGPSVTRYEVELEKGVRLNKLTTAADDIALSLGATGVRIAAVPGKISVVGIEVPNRAVTTVSLREVIDSVEFNKAKSKSTFAVGKDIGGSCIVGNIAKLPHMLIAGTTGSGKSVCMNSIIISLLYKASPDDVKLIMVDPKMVELGIYNGIPHLLIPVVTDPKKAAGSLQWAVTEMMRRYRAMSDAGVRDLESYNSIIDSQDTDSKHLPQVVVIIDELADLMLVAAKEVEESICRIAQMGRAAGIHLVIATQRPSADVITGLMKANIPSRIAFAVASAMESRIILDTQGAEKLVGKGDMLYAPIGNGKPKRVQGCFVTDGEVEAVTSYVKANYTTDYDQAVIEEIEKKAVQTGKQSASEPEPTADELDGDEMLPAAVDVILETGQASVSMLQRRLKLGYARAARIVDEMEEKGIVGPFQGSKPRSILVTKEQWAAMRSGQGEAQMDFDDLSDATEMSDEDEF